MRFTTIDSKLAHNSSTVSKWFLSPSIRYPSCDIMVLNIKRMLYHGVNVPHLIHVSPRYRREHFFSADFKWKKYLRSIDNFRRNFIAPRMNIDYRTVSLRKLNSIVADNRFEFWCFLSGKKTVRRNTRTVEARLTSRKNTQRDFISPYLKGLSKMSVVCVGVCGGGRVCPPSHVMENKSTSRQ